MRIAHVGSILISATLVTTSSGSRAQEVSRRLAPLVPLNLSTSAPALARAKESLVLGRITKPSDPDAKILDVASGVGIGVGAAGLCLGGLFLLTRLGTKKKPQRTERAVTPHVIKVGTKGAVVGVKATF